MDDIDVVIAFASSPAKLVLSVESAGFVSISGEKRGRVGEGTGLMMMDISLIDILEAIQRPTGSLSSIHG